MLRLSDLSTHTCAFVPYDGRPVSEEKAKILADVEQTVAGIFVEICTVCHDIRFSPGFGRDKMMHPSQHMVK